MVYDNEVVPIFEKNINCNTRGHSMKYYVERCKYDTRKYNFCHRIIQHWNSLPHNIIEAQSVNSFKNKLDNFYVDKDCYYQPDFNLGYDNLFE